MDALGRPRHQHGERVDVLVERLLQRRHQRPLVGEHAFLLRHVEIGAGARLAAILHRIEDALGARDVLLGGTQPVLRGQHVEIGGRHRRQGGQRSDIAIEAIGGCGLFRSLKRIAVAAPEVELIGGAQRSVVVGDLATIIGQAAGARTRRAGISLRAVALQRRQQRSSRLARQRVGLHACARRRRRCRD